MCALRAHIRFHFWKKNFSRIEKVMTAFSILEKIFLKIESLMCALSAHINQTHIYIYIYLEIYYTILLFSFFAPLPK